MEVRLLEHSYGMTTFLGLSFLYGGPSLSHDGDVANCHYGLAVGSLFIGLIWACDANLFEWE